MSDLPGAMTKQILSAPPRSIRSTRYSLTARGRSARSPSGSNSLENASGWIRVPCPAAGMTPHILFAPLRGFDRRVRARVDRDRPQAEVEDVGDQLAGAVCRRVLLQNALSRGIGDPCGLLRRERQGGGDILGVLRGQDLASGLEEAVQPFPGVAHDGAAASRRLEQP